MSDFALKRESVDIMPDFNVLISEFENKKELRRLVTPSMLSGWKITTPDMTKTTMQTYFAHFTSKFGPLTSFTFTCPFTDTEYNVRYKPGSFRVRYETGFFKGEFEFERVF